ncbi:P-loop containing nucleoside triphosphate hydrolase protein [Colletotrichum godetiae]|uniref:RNA helicase n=1 Tax=Colletotrichum godetiae TaxID=1209918 RepID=A0AAJ0AXG9_9PEZI|nr:P-loop containing nucleoside triphosphate hydrolase protein [Colletotrichum godetiae]KAK1691382.1 P-loop containing nucleoside triphosphate hydrolase protein [Colletotrichum godetiae]
MSSRTLASLCPKCHLTLRPQPFPRLTTSPWFTQSAGFRSATKGKPSRMVLSDDVARPRDREARPPRRQVEGPFGGMNQTFARVPERRTARPPNARDARDSRGGSSSRYSRGDSQTSSDPRKALKMQRSLAGVSYGKRNVLKDKMQEYESFDQFNLLPIMKDGIKDDLLRGMVDLKPTPIQRLAIPAMLGQSSAFKVRGVKRQDFLLAAETGSGKTLAYMLPAVNAMKIAEEANPEIQSFMKRFQEEKEREQMANKGPKSKKMSAFDEPHPTMARPRIIVLVPSAELVEQVGKVAKTLSHAVKFKAEILSANLKALTIQRNLYSPRGVDMVVTTPHLLASIAESDPNVLSQVTHLIVDEADSLFDRSFAPVTTTIIDRAMPSLKQFILCSATIPKRLDNYLANNFPDMTRITTPNLHAIPRRVQLGVIDVVKDPYRNNKNLACADAIYTIGREASKHEGPIQGEIDVRRIMVFVNEREKTTEVAEYLQSKGIDAVALNRDSAESRQSEMLQAFTSSEPLRAVSSPEAVVPGKRSLPNTKVIVATDLASRGIDTLAVRHVILYDVPHTTIDFIHRLGRAGRMGRRGRGIVLVGKDDKKDVVAEVKESMFMGQALI